MLNSSSVVYSRHVLSLCKYLLLWSFQLCRSVTAQSRPQLLFSVFCTNVWYCGTSNVNPDSNDTFMDCETWSYDVKRGARELREMNRLRCSFDRSRSPVQSWPNLGKRNRLADVEHFLEQLLTSLVDLHKRIWCWYFGSQEVRSCPNVCVSCTDH